MPAKTVSKHTKLSRKQHEELLQRLKARFERYPDRHKELRWDAVHARVSKDSAKLWSLSEMERTGGEPDVVGQDKRSGEYMFCDCSPESPAGRRSLCYDGDALASRKENKPADSAVAMAATMGIEL